VFLVKLVDPSIDVLNKLWPNLEQNYHRMIKRLPKGPETHAARMKLFPPDALLARLSSRLVLLSGGARDLPMRQQTMRNTIAWSYDLLTEGEQTLFRRLGVFVGGWTLAAAEAVCHGEPDLALSVVAGMATLVNQSLVQPQERSAGEARFTMLENHPRVCAGAPRSQWRGRAAARAARPLLPHAGRG
jgi:predicted ATPase